MKNIRYFISIKNKILIVKSSIVRGNKVLFIFLFEITNEERKRFLLVLRDTVYILPSEITLQEKQNRSKVVRVVLLRSKVFSK